MELYKKTIVNLMAEVEEKLEALKEKQQNDEYEIIYSLKLENDDQGFPECFWIETKRNLTTGATESKRIPELPLIKNYVIKLPEIPDDYGAKYGKFY